MSQHSLSTSRARFSRSQRGLSLVELMIAMVIGLVIIAGAIGIFIGNKKAYRTTAALSHIQEAARFAMHSFESDIQATGAWGCGVRDEAPPDVLTGSMHGLKDEDAITGKDDDNATGSITDTLTLRGSKGTKATHLDSDMGSLTADLSIPKDTGSGIESGDILLITDCDSAQIFRATGPSDPDGSGKIEHGSSASTNTTNQLNTKFTEDSSIFQVFQAHYSVQDKDGVPTLMRAVNGNTAQPLIQGVHSLEITYGIDSNNNKAANYYTNAGNVTNMDDVVSVHVAMVLRSRKDRITTEKQTYSFQGNNVTAPDRRLYKVFSSTFTIRNRAR